MNLFINGSNRRKNCFNILDDIRDDKDELILLSHKDIKYCLGCNACINKLENYCVLDDYMSKYVYSRLREADKIIVASPLYMSSITGLLKNVIDRCNPFYHHNYFVGKKLYLILTGQGSYDDNEEEINDIVKYFTGISEWLNFDFVFLDYFSSGSLEDVDDVKKTENDYHDKIRKIKEVLND